MFELSGDVFVGFEQFVDDVEEYVVWLVVYVGVLVFYDEVCKLVFIYCGIEKKGVWFGQLCEVIYCVYVDKQLIVGEVVYCILWNVKKVLYGYLIENGYWFVCKVDGCKKCI